MTDWVSGDEAVEYSTSWKCFSVPISLFRHCLIHYFSSRILVGSVSCLFIEYDRDGYIRDNQDDIDKAITTQLILGLVIINPS